MKSYKTRSGPKIPAVGPFGGRFLFGLDKFGHLMVNMPYLPNFRSLEPPHGLEEPPQRVPRVPAWSTKIDPAFGRVVKQAGIGVVTPSYE